MFTHDNEKPETPAETEVEDKVPVVDPDTLPMTIDEAVDRLKSVGRAAKARGISAITKRLFDGIDGFLGGDPKKPKE